MQHIVHILKNTVVGDLTGYTYIAAKNSGWI